MDLRHHQIECKSKIEEYFNDNNKGLIKMFCGAGKSFIIFDSILNYLNDLAVIVVPSINLITQFNEDYLINNDKIKYNKNNYNKDFQILTICSKNELHDNKTKIKFTTDEEEIQEFLFHEDNKIILITYQSLSLLVNIIKENELNIDIMCFDEAHHILGDGIKKLLFGSDDFDDINQDDDASEYQESFIDSFVDKTLFFTATPKNSNGIKMYEPVTGYDINNENYEIIDDEDTYDAEETHCGAMIYEYMHIDGVRDGILNDFNIRVDLYTENKDNSVFEAIARSILESGNNRVLTFHARSEKASDKGSDVLSFTCDTNKKLLDKAFNKVVNTEFPDLKNKFKKITFDGITANTKNKRYILKDFDETPDDEIYILASCKTIGEGVDTKNANMVVFCDPKQSYVDIIQNIGRICRKNKNTKRNATVLIPSYVDVEKYKDCKTDEEKDNVIRSEMSKCGNFNGILNVLSALRQEDPYMFELCLKYPDTYTEKEINENLNKNGLKLDKKEYSINELFSEHGVKYNDEKSEKKNFKKLARKLEKNVQVINKKILEDDIYIDSESDETLYFVKKDDNVYCKTNGVCKEKKLKKPNRNIKPFVHANDEIKVLWNIDGDINLNKKIFGGYIKSTVISSSEDNWMEMLEKVKKYIDENGKRPNNRIKKEEKLCSWIQLQSRNILNHKGIINNKFIRKKWDEFILEYKKYFLTHEQEWKKNLEAVSKYINEFKKRPSKRDNNYEIKKIAKWISRQQNNYNKHNNIMKKEFYRSEWKKFLNEKKNYFQSNEDEWNIQLDLVEKYINEHNKRPSCTDKNINIKKLGCWLSAQNDNYLQKKYIMKNTIIYEKFKEFIQKYKSYLLTNEERWNNTLESVKKYIYDNNEKPTRYDKNSKIKQLGEWLSDQQKNYKNNNDIMKNNDIRKKWEDFILEHKKYFLSHEEIWDDNINLVIEFINKFKRRPSDKKDNNSQESILARWIGTQIQNYKNKNHIMENNNICIKWEKFIKEYKQLFLSNEEEWINNLENLKNFIDKNNRKPSHKANNISEKQLYNWFQGQIKNYKNHTQIMKNPEIHKKWEEFITEYKEYFPNFDIEKVDNDIPQPEEKVITKPTTIKYKEEKPSSEDNEREIIRMKSEYQKIADTMTRQKSTKTKVMFNDKPQLWEQYHKARDISFKGYEQKDIPVNKIIAYLETKKNKKLKILDLGCGRNIIKDHFKDNNKFDITGYDYVSYNNSIACDISNLPDEDESVDVCIFSQSLMGYNWQSYIEEAMRVLRYNGEMIISESHERYEIIRKFIEEQGLHIKSCDYKKLEKEGDQSNRWFYMHIINDKA